MENEISLLVLEQLSHRNWLYIRNYIDFQIHSCFWYISFLSDMIQNVLSHANSYTEEGKIKYTVQRQW